MPVALNTAMIAASRRCANVLPRQAFSSFESSTLVKNVSALQGRPNCGFLSFTSTGVVYGVADPGVTVASGARRVGVT